MPEKITVTKIFCNHLLYPLIKNIMTPKNIIVEIKKPRRSNIKAYITVKTIVKTIRINVFLSSNCEKAVKSS